MTTPPPTGMARSIAAHALLAQIDAATCSGDAGAVRDALARCATGLVTGEIDASNAALVCQAGKSANKAMRDAVRRMALIVKVAKAADTKRCVDQATSITLLSDQFKRLNDRDWATQLLAAGNTKKGGARKASK